MCEKDIVLKHFNSISSTYDENNKKVYWKLVDDLLWEIIKEYIPNPAKRTNTKNLLYFLNFLKYH